MGCCGGAKVGTESKAKIKSYEDRKCRDVLCIPIFAAWWGAMIFVAYTGFDAGDPAYLLYGTDYDQRTCGSSKAVCHGGKEGSCGKYITYPRMDLDLTLALQQGVNFLDLEELMDFPWYGVCRSACPKKDEWVCNSNATEYLNDRYGAASDWCLGEECANADRLSAASEEALATCMKEKDSAGWLSPLSEECSKLTRNCWKIFVEEDDMFFRCIPVTALNSTCAQSPFLTELQETGGCDNESPVGTKFATQVEAEGCDVGLRYQASKDLVSGQWERGTQVRRLAQAKEHCGVCLEPTRDERNMTMDPASKSCKAVHITFTGEQTSAVINPIMEQLSGWTQQLREWMGDVELCIDIIAICSLAVSVVLGFVWLVLLRLFAPLFVWGSVWGFFLLCAFLTAQFMILGGVIPADQLSSAFADAQTVANDAAGEDAVLISPNDIFSTEADEQEAMYEIAGWVMLVVTTIVLILIFAMWSKIKIAAQVIQEATKAIAAMPSIMAFPFCTVSFTLINFGYFIYIALYILSASEPMTIDLPVLNTTAAEAALAEADVQAAAASRMLSAAPEQLTGSNIALLAPTLFQTATLGGISRTAAASGFILTVQRRLMARYDETGEYNVDADLVDDRHWGRALQDQNTTNSTSSPTSALTNTPTPMDNSTAAVFSAVGGEAKAILSNMDAADYMFLVHFFGFLWTNQLIAAVGMVTVAGAVASWYWASPDEKKKRDELEAFPVFNSLKRALRFSFGSMLFGAFIIALIQQVLFIRFCLAYLDKQTKGLQDKNIVLKVFMKVVQCCLWCFEKLIKYISKNAYILIAVHGYGFCQGAKEAFMLIIMNLGKMATSTAVSNLIIMVARLTIVAGSTVVCFGMIALFKSGDEAPTSELMPCLVVALASFYVSGCFMNIYGLAIDTIMISFIEDSKHNDGSTAKPYYASKGLLSIIGKRNKKGKTDGTSAADEGDDADGAEQTPVEKYDEGGDEDDML